METRYKVYQRGNGIYYLEDVVINQQESLRTRDRKKALALLVARNQAAFARSSGSDQIFRNGTLLGLL